MASAELGHLYLLTSAASALHPSEPPIRRGRNPERIRNRQTFLKLSEDLFEQHSFEKIPQWPFLDKLTSPVELELAVGVPTVSIQVAHFAYHDYNTNALDSVETAIVATSTDQLEPCSLFKVLQRFALWEDDFDRVYLTRVSDHSGQVASDSELSSAVGALRWIAEKLQDSK